MSRATYRIAYLKRLWPELKRWHIYVAGVFGVFTFIRDELLPSNLSSGFRLVDLVLLLPTTTFLSIILLLLLIGFFEAAFRVHEQDRERLITNKISSPLEVIFDPSNPRQRFWSIARKPSADASTTYSYYRYSVLLRNRGMHTLRDVKVIAELTGKLRNSPSFGTFEISNDSKTDLHPGEERFVEVFHWPYPAIQAGMLAGNSAKWGYGDLKVSVSATDTPVLISHFHVDYTQEPMLYESAANPALQH